MFGYRNAVYNSREQTVDVYTWTEDGDRIHTSVPCLPYFFYEDINGEDTSVFNTPLRKKEFNSYYNKKLFIKERGLKQLFDNYSPVQQTLIDMFWKYNDNEDFTKFPLKIFFVDIEAVGPNGFSSPHDPKEEINVITVYDSLTKKFIVWGSQQYNNKASDVIYNFCQTEEDLLERFIDFIQKDPPDILSGWASDRYDVPYIVNRIERVLGAERANDLSPYKRRYVKEFAGKFGKKELVHRIDGISSVDYMDIYKKFCPSNRESYKLDYIGYVELDETKVDYGDLSLYELMVSDWDTFVDYNIQDVRLLVKLEERLSYVELLRMLAYTGCTTFESALGTVSVVTGAAAIEARNRNQRLCTFVVDDEDMMDFEGGYVAEPVVGHHKSIVSFDANSLYPNTMITLNTSPETKMGKILSMDKNGVSIRNIDGVVVDFNLTDFKNYLHREKIAISKSKVLFTQKRKGVLADMVDKFYKKRVKIRAELKTLKKKIKKSEGDELIKINIKINQLDTKQQSIKIFINSAYGATANRYCPIGDLDIAESITLTGQALIKESRTIFKNFVKEKNKNISDEEIEYSLIANDTDSLYVSIDKLVSNFSNKGIVSEEAYQIAEEFEKYLNDNIKSWAIKTLNTNDSRFEFKREAMCDYGMFLEKKRYVLHVLDKEGIQCNEWKYTGVEVVSTKMPKSVKPYVKKIIQNMISTKDESSTNDILKSVYELFYNMDENEISIVSGIRNLEKYEEQCDGFSTCKNMPWHVKAGYFYNILLEEMGLTKKYEKIVSGDKIRLFYVETPNPYGINAIAYKTRYPQEFKEFLKPAIEVMFEKDIYKCIERFYKVMNWVPRKPTEQLICTLDDILG
jgi:DNA polymerase elongation subunit (family B)